MEDEFVDEIKIIGKRFLIFAVLYIAVLYLLVEHPETVDAFLSQLP